MPTKAHLVVIVRCPLCGSWIVNTRFREHQGMVHPADWRHGFSGPPGASAILEVPPTGLSSSTGAGPEIPVPVDDGEIMGLDPTAAALVLQELRLLIRLGLDAALAFHMWHP